MNDPMVLIAIGIQVVCIAIAIGVWMEFKSDRADTKKFNEKYYSPKP